MCSCCSGRSSLNASDPQWQGAVVVSLFLRCLEAEKPKAKGDISFNLTFTGVALVLRVDAWLTINLLLLINSTPECCAAPLCEYAFIFA